eukprot:1612983-Rhodomonas_salina.5
MHDVEWLRCQNDTLAGEGLDVSELQSVALIDQIHGDTVELYNATRRSDNQRPELVCAGSGSRKLSTDERWLLHAFRTFSDSQIVPTLFPDGCRVSVDGDFQGSCFWHQVPEAVDQDHHRK